MHAMKRSFINFIIDKTQASRFKNVNPFTAQDANFHKRLFSYLLWCSFKIATF